MDDKLSIEQKSFLVDVLSNEMARLVYKRAILRNATGEVARSLFSDCEHRISMLNEILNLI